jgi:glycosyltransferase involved in cell wall biosynthesis
MNQSLTIAIPYFKRRYLEAALESLARQSDQNFDVFIGDDASPENPSGIIKQFQGRLNIKYRRFPENLGGNSLAAHWNRCVQETASEWVWLFSDDDMVSENCVAEFYKVLAGTDGSFDLYRFNTKIINAEGKIIYDPPKHPMVEAADEFLFAKFIDRRTSCAVEYIFRRSAFNTRGGFINFPLAWCSDDASWLAFSRRTGIRTIQNADVQWRLSDSNLSAANPALIKIKLNAFRQYLLWLRGEFPDPTIQQKLRMEVAKWFPDQVDRWGGKPGLVAGMQFWRFFSRYTRNSDFELLRTLLNLPRVRGYNRLKKLLHEKNKSAADGTNP